MAYSKINKTRFAYLLRFGVGEDELRRFFSEKRIPLIQKGGKVQNVPRGTEARVNAMVALPPGTDPIVQQWFSTNLTMLDPESANELVDTFRMYEELNESLSESEAKRLSRSCLIHLFSENPPEELVDFLKSSLASDGSEPDSDYEPDSDKEALQQLSPPPTDAVLLDAALAASLVALVEGKDPDEFVSGLPPAIASFVTGLHAIREGHADETQSALEDLENLEKARAILSSYAARHTKAKESAKSTMSGVQLIRFEENEDPEFDSDRDEIIGICTKDSPENAVFIRPFAIRTGDGTFLSLGRQDQREMLFPSSGDVMAFHGRGHPRQPKRGELGIWQVTPNSDTIHAHRTNFHLTSAKVDVYEVRLVPFKSNEYDSVREYIKEQITRNAKNQSGALLFLLSDDLIVGCPPGKELSRDDGFETGLPCWRTLNAFRFEGRTLVPGPLPAHEQYECETLASSFRKVLLSNRSDSEKLTKAQQKHLQDLLNSGEAHLNAARSARLREELGFIERHEGVIDLLLDEAMQDESVKARVDKFVHDKAKEQIEKKSELTGELARLEKRLAELKEKLSKQEKEQRALPSAVSRAIKASVEKAKGDAMDTLGQVIVFKTLMDELQPGHKTNTASVYAPAPNIRAAEPAPKPLVDILRSLGVSPKHARALELTGDLAFTTGLFLVIEGTAARLATEAWAGKNGNGSMVMECGIGVTDDTTIREIAATETRSIVILDANLSPVDVYARPLIDRVQRRISTSPEDRESLRVLMSLSDSVAGLPLPRSVEALAVRVSLDSNIEFLREDDAQTRLEDAESDDVGESWASLLWKPALKVLLAYLKDISPDDAALVISVLEAGHR